MRLTSTCVLVLSVLVFAGAASAGNGNGKGNESDAPGSSASAPGQVKKDTPPAAPETTTTTAAVTLTTTTAAPENATGVKPANDTAHDTHAQAQSNQTKEYGNGQTAGQIAEKNGADGKDVIHGPGNSQPHKLAPCSGGHEVDVHALKSHHRSGSCGGPTPPPNPSPTPTPGPNPGPPSHPTTTTTTTPTGKPSDPASGDAPSAVATVHGHASHSHGVLAVTQAATLPFTGQRLWLAALVGLILIATGLALREIRTAEASVESGHDHTDRSRSAARSTRAPLGGGPGR